MDKMVVMDRYQESNPGIREIAGDQMTNTTTVICARKVGWVRERGGCTVTHSIGRAQDIATMEDSNNNEG